MESRDENKYSMYLAVKKLLITNTVLWMAIAGMASVVALFFAKLLLLKATDNKRTKKTKGITEDKKNKKVELIDGIMAVAGAIKSFANDVNDQDLYQSVNFVRSDLETMGDTTLDEKATLVSEIATLHAADIAPKGIGAAELATFNLLISEYADLMQAPRNAISNKKTAGGMLRTLFSEIDNLLHNNLDQLMQQFKLSNPEFYGNYFNNRKILDLGIHHTRLGGIVTDSEGNPVEGAMVLVNLVDLEEETDAGGAYLFKPFTPDDYIVTVEKAGFVTQTIANIHVSAGENFVLDVVLEREVYSGTINSGQVVNVLSPANPRWVAGCTVRFKNTTNGPMIGGLLFYGANNASDGFSGQGANLLPGQEQLHTVTAAEYKPYFNIQDQGPNNGSWEVEIL